MNALFRPEAIAAKRRRLLGEVRLAQPPSFAIWTVVLSTSGAMVLTALVFGTYNKKETVQGFIAPEAGVLQAVAPRSGVVRDLRVSAGDLVQAGSPLLEMGDASSSAERGPVLTAQLSEVALQQSALSERRRAMEAGIASEERRLRNQLNALSVRLVSLAKARRVQSSIVELSEADGRRFDDLAGRGYAPRSEVDRRRRTTLGEQARLLDLERETQTVEATLAETEIQLAAVPARRAAAVAELEGERAVLAQTIFELELARRQVVTAPVAGVVSDIAAKPGQSVQAGQPLAAILPSGSELEAQLLVPTRAAGFLQVGQTAKLQIQAYPFQRFGFVEGEVRAIARSVIRPGDEMLPVQITEPVYRVRIRLKSTQISAYGQGRTLAPGMLLQADLITSRRRLWQYLLDPLLAAGKRLG
jgi:membrane fusion protein